MPLYEYECSKCHKKIEIIQKVGGTAPKKCPYCGGALKKLLSTPAIKFKGSGWYVTDYAGNKAGLNSSTHPKNQKKVDSAVKDTPNKIKPKPTKTHHNH